MIPLLFLLASFVAAVPAWAAEEVHTVIRVTPTLAYIDVGSEAAARIGSTFAIVELEDGNRYYAEVGQVRLIRLFDDFSIGEILAVKEGAQIQVLHRAMALGDWQRRATAPGRRAVAAGLVERSVPKAEGDGAWSGRVFYVLGGIDWAKGVKVDADFGVPSVSQTADRDLGLRVATGFGRQWRANFTYRLAGKPLGATGVEVTQIAFELDLHRALGAFDAAAFYLGAGLGIHQLEIKQRQLLDESSVLKPSVNLSAGWQRPTRHWTLVAEAGYLFVSAWEAGIDVSGVRTYLGVGKNF